jgi:hypothetical protein
MVALTPHRWFATAEEVLLALAGAQSVETVAHLCLPNLAASQVQFRPSPRLFRDIEKPMDSFSKWWVQVNKNVRHLQQLVYPKSTRTSTP